MCAVVHPPSTDTSKHIYLFERGIMGWASLLGGWNNWPNQAVVWIHRHTRNCRAFTLLYFVDALLAAMTRHRRAESFKDVLMAYPDSEGWKLHICAHSEGTATVLLALRLACWPRIETLHLVSGACDGNFERNGLNHALEHGKIGHVFVYVAGKDYAMLAEDTILGRRCFGLRDKPMGLTGARNVRPHLNYMVTPVLEPHFGHSDWFTRKNFDRTMRRFLS